MVMEFIFSSAKIYRHPGIIFYEAVFLSLISVVFSIFVFPTKYISIGILAFITIGSIPIFAKLFSYSSYLFNYSESFFTRHRTLFLQLINFFLGVFVTFVFLFFLLSPTTKEVVFSTQFSEIRGIANIRNSITGQVSHTRVDSDNIFSKVFWLIFNNNLGVTIRAAVLSFFYGAGALFLIAWNASILATVIASDVAKNAGLVFAGNFGVFGAILQSFISLLGYVPHGLPELLAYFIISFTGAMFARDLMKGLFLTEFKWKIITDILFMMLLALVLLIIGALIEASYFL